MSFKIGAKIEEEIINEDNELSSIKGYMSKNTYIAKINQFTCEVDEINYLEMLDKESYAVK